MLLSLSMEELLKGKSGVVVKHFSIVKCDPEERTQKEKKCRKAPRNRTAAWFVTTTVGDLPTLGPGSLSSDEGHRWALPTDFYGYFLLSLSALSSSSLPIKPF